MSSSPLSSKNSTFAPSQANYFNRQNSNLTSPMNLNRHSPGPPSTTMSTATRIVGPKPFYRSRVTPEPYDYSNYHRRENDSQQYRQSPLTRRSSVNQIEVHDEESLSSDESLSIEFPPPPNEFSSSPVSDQPYQFVPVQHPFIRSDSGSSLSTSYFSDHESSSPKHTHYPQYRSTTPTGNSNGNRPMISVSASQSPVITIASRASPNRSEIRFVSSPIPSKSAVREIRISRPDSPSISINNRSGISNSPLAYTNGTDNAFHISLGTPAKIIPRDLSVSSPPPTLHRLGRTSPSFRQMEVHRDSPVDNRYPSNVTANRFKPLISYPNPNGRNSPVLENSERRSSTLVNLPPTSFPMRNGNQMKKPPADLDHLTKLLMKTMNSSNEPNFFGMCARCNDEIVGEENGLVAMDRMYHVSCFTCTMCGCRLRGMHFYSMENQPYCESCYINSLEKCVVCARPITDRILRATGKPYHAECFSCTVCRQSLDGRAFTIDARMDVHCIECFHQKFAPRCYACQRAILPNPGQEETTRIVALDRNYHLECYRCEKCQIQFTLEEGCYPIDEHLLCLQCNRLYSKTRLGHT